MDGDRYHKKLPRRYQQLYKQAGQGHFSNQEIAHNAIRIIKKEAQNYGDAIIKALGHIADQIEHVMALPVLRQLVDRDAFKSKIEQTLQGIPGSPRGKNLALRACERYLNELDTTTDMVQVRQTLIASYLGDIYVANFESRVKMPPGTTKYGIAHAHVLNRLPQIREYVEPYITQLAGSIARSSSLKNIRLSKSPRANEVVSLDEIVSL